MVRQQGGRKDDPIPTPTLTNRLLGFHLKWKICCEYSTKWAITWMSIRSMAFFLVNYRNNDNTSNLRDFTRFMWYLRPGVLLTNSFCELGPCGRCGHTGWNTIHWNVWCLTQIGGVTAGMEGPGPAAGGEAAQTVLTLEETGASLGDSQGTQQELAGPRQPITFTSLVPHVHYNDVKPGTPPYR